IALTANAAAGERERCLAFGMNEYLSKPIDALLLAQVLEEWTAQAPSPAAAPAEPSAAVPAPAPTCVFDRAPALQRLGDGAELLNVALSAFRENAPSVLQSARPAPPAGAAA